MVCFCQIHKYAGQKVGMVGRSDFAIIGYLSDLPKAKNLGFCRGAVTHIAFGSHGREGPLIDSGRRLDQRFVGGRAIQ